MLYGVLSPAVAIYYSQNGAPAAAPPGSNRLHHTFGARDLGTIHHKTVQVLFLNYIECLIGVGPKFDRHLGLLQGRPNQAL
jgi:hypothetical protein